MISNRCAKCYAPLVAVDREDDPTGEQEECINCRVVSPNWREVGRTTIQLVFYDTDDRAVAELTQQKRLERTKVKTKTAKRKR